MRHLHSSDLRGVARLATQATLGTTGIVEAVHQSVWRTLGAPGGADPARTRGLTGLVYRCVHGITGAIGSGIDLALARLQPLLDGIEGAPMASPQRVAVLAALNGVLGDRLAADANPLAIPMGLWRDGSPFDPATLAASGNGRILLLVHGLCMNDLQWQTWRTGGDGALVPALDHGQALAAELGHTPVYLRYNTGRHVSENGQDLAALLEQLVAAWPVPVQELTVVAHSMGGLVMRSATDLAQAAGMHWPSRLRHIVFLGTPHHGAPLERAGHWVDQLLGQTPYAAPFARLARLRSSGITDLRHGSVSAHDWQGRDRHAHGADDRVPVPLPAGVACFAVAATLAPRRGALAERLLGDGLVPLASALGQHRDAARDLGFAPARSKVLYRTGHMRLLGDPAVTRQLTAWLQPSSPGPS